MNDSRKVLGGALAAMQSVKPDLYSIPADMLDRWHVAPTATPDAEHEDFCSGGYVFLPDGEAAPCPVCAHQKKLSSTLASMRKAEIPERYLHVTWADLEPLEPFPRLQHGAARIGELMTANASLLLWGAHGAGKTQAAMLLARAALEANYTARVVILGDLAIDVRDGYSQSGDRFTERQAIEAMSKPDLLILEDLGAAETDNAKLERRLLYLAMNARQNARKPSIITTNLEPKAFVEMVGARIYNRCQPLTILEFKHGKNFRTPQKGADLW